MLSIGKLVAGQARYYLDQAEGRVDAVESIGEGLEDYYGEQGDAASFWFGHEAAALALEGFVEGDQLRPLLAGVDPGSATVLRDRVVRTRVAGFDLTFSAPKSVSIAFAVGPAELRQSARAAHDEAVQQALGYLERTAAAVRRGHAGAVVERAEGLAVATFRHRTSRAGDPQLHTHALVANIARGSDGRWSSLDGRHLYSHARAASFIYQAVLRSELSRTMGVEWTAVREGIAELEGVPRPAIDAFSQRRREIEQALKERGTAGPRAAEAAALATRTRKRLVDPRLLDAEWRTRAIEHGVTDESLRSVMRQRQPEPPTDWRRSAENLLHAEGLTRDRAAFSRRDVIIELCQRLPPGTSITGAQLELAADGLLAGDEVIPLTQPTSAREGDRAGALLVASEERRYSTTSHLAIEQRVIEAVLDGRAKRAAVVASNAIDRVLSPRRSLSPEQREMVRGLCSDGDRVAIVVGSAGTGKTFALGAAREAWRAAGHPVLGAALARRAAQELQAGSGIPSTSVAALLGRLRVGEGLPDGCVLVVDEAGQVGTRDLAELIDHAAAARGKLVLVGDHRQLPEIQAGGAFLGLVQRGVALQLGDNRRQSQAWERQAVAQLRARDAEPALRLYAEHGRLRIATTPELTRQRLVADWWEGGQLEESLMIAARRSEVADLNARARSHMRRAGRLGDIELELPGGTFAAGDHVVLRHNDRRLEVNNGDRGVVTAVDPARGAVDVDSRGRRVRLGPDYLLAGGPTDEAALQHGYAITCHIAQGTTLQRAYVLAGDALNAEWGYTALTRGREANYLYASETTGPEREQFAPRDLTAKPDAVPVRLARALRASGAQTLALDELRQNVAVRDHLQQIERDIRRARAALEPPSHEPADERSRRQRLLRGPASVEDSVAERTVRERIAALEHRRDEIARSMIEPPSGRESVRRRDRDSGRGIER